MYRVGDFYMNIIIIEDNAYSLNMLVNIIEKSFKNKNIVGKFQNAETALEYIKYNSVDAIICDIKLPGIDGLEFAKICTKNYPFIPIAFISAYSLFEYAKKALNTNVVSYILKPITYDKLCEALDTLEKTSVRNGKNTFTDYATLEIMQKELSKKLYLFKFRDATEDKTLGITPLAGKNIYIVTLEEKNLEQYLLSVWTHNFDRLKKAISNVLSSANNEVTAFYLSYDKPFFDIVIISDKELAYGSICSYITPLFTLLKFPAEIKCTTHISDVFNRDEIIAFNIKKMLLLIFETNLDVDICFENFSDKELTRFSEELFERAVSKLGIAGIKELDFSKIGNTGNVARDELETILTEKINNIRHCAVQSKSDIISQAIAYVNESCSKNISLADVAKHVALSPKYFSRYFKEETGYNFLAYREQLRIKKAIEMIQKDNKIKNSALAQKLGYESESTFCKSFKKITGFSTSHYRNTELDGNRRD